MTVRPFVRLFKLQSIPLRLRFIGIGMCAPAEIIRLALH